MEYWRRSINDYLNIIVVGIKFSFRQNKSATVQELSICRAQPRRASYSSPRPRWREREGGHGGAMGRVRASKRRRERGRVNALRVGDRLPIESGGRHGRGNAPHP